MSRRLVLIHTVSGLVPTFEALVARHLPEWKASNIVDESLLRNTIAEGSLSRLTMRRVAGHIWSAADAGADAILVTCSSIGPAVDATAPFMDVPLMRVDEGMADRASELGSRIGIAATLSTTLDPTRDLVERLAQAKGRSIRTVAKLCEGAFERLAAGDREGHDAIVSRGIAQLADEVDVILLAQASMARVLEGEGAPRLNVPVLSSPETGILHLRTSLESNAAAARG